MISEAEALAIWRRAKAHPVGICVRTDNRYNLTQRLYQIRARYKDQEDFSELTLTNAPESNEVWVIHKPKGSAPVTIKPMTEEDLDDL